jgi:hypothetical protein
MTAAARAIARTTCTELLRLPAFGLLLLASLAALALSPILTLFDVDESRLLQDFGASTLSLSGVLLTALGISVLLGKELERRTVLTLLAKPVGRGTFLLGKLAGVLGAVGLALATELIVLLLAARVGPPRSSHDPADVPVLICGLAVVVLTPPLALALGWRRRSFQAPAIVCGALLLAAGAAVAGAFARDGSLQAWGAGYDAVLLRAAVLGSFAAVTLGGVAVLLTVLLGRGAFVLTLAAFVLALLGGGQEGLLWGILPDLDVFWVGEVFYSRDAQLPWGHIGLAALYSLAHAAAAVAAAGLVLSRRDVG